MEKKPPPQKHPKSSTSPSLGVFGWVPAARKQAGCWDRCTAFITSRWRTLRAKMLSSTCWKCLLPDGDMCWQTLPHFIKKEGKKMMEWKETFNLQWHEGHWDRKRERHNQSSVHFNIYIGIKYNPCNTNQKIIFMHLSTNCQSSFIENGCETVYFQDLTRISSCKLCKTTSSFRIFPQEIFFYPMSYFWSTSCHICSPPAQVHSSICVCITALFLL